MLVDSWWPFPFVHSFLLPEKQRLMMFMISYQLCNRPGYTPVGTTTPRMHCGGWEVLGMGRQQAPPHSPLPLEERSHSQEAARGRGSLRGSRRRRVPASSGSGQSAVRLRLAPVCTEPTRSQGVPGQVNGMGRALQEAGRWLRREGRGVDWKVLGWFEEAVQGWLELLWCRRFELSGRFSFGEVRFLSLKRPQIKECQNASFKLFLQEEKNVNFPSVRILKDLSLAFESLEISESSDTRLYALVLMASLSASSPTSELLRGFLPLRVPFLYRPLLTFLFFLNSDKYSVSLPRPISTASDLYVVVIIGQYLTNSDH